MTTPAAQILMSDTQRLGTPREPQPPQQYLTPRSRLAAVRLGVPDPDGFNGAVITSQGKTLLVYRTARDNPSLACCYLDEDFRVVTHSHRTMPFYRNADPRLIEFGGRVYVVTSYYGDGYDRERIELRRLTLGQSGIEASEVVAKFDHIDNDSTYRRRREKNWVPFVYGDALCFVYRMRPHRVIRYDPATRRVALLAEVKWSLPDRWPAEWCGALRLNTNPVPLPDGTYLSTFHAYVPGHGYFNGFYLFEGQPPFRVLRVGARPFTHPADATGSNPRGGRNGVVFLQSLWVDDGPQRVYLSGGDNDHSVIVIGLGLDHALTGMIDVQTTPSERIEGAQSFSNLKKAWKGSAGSDRLKV